jgi:predicted component of type VI protein secretion system
VLTPPPGPYFADITQYLIGFLIHSQVISSSTQYGIQQQKKLSYKDSRELSLIEEVIAKAEERLQATQREIDSGQHSSNTAKLSELCSLLTEQQTEVERLYSRWQELESLRASLT